MGGRRCCFGGVLHGNREDVFRGKQSEVLPAGHLVEQTRQQTAPARTGQGLPLFRRRRCISPGGPPVCESPRRRHPWRCVELGQHDAGTRDSVGEVFRLADSVLAGGGVEDEDCLVGCLGESACPARGESCAIPASGFAGFAGARPCRRCKRRLPSQWPSQRSGGRRRPDRFPILPLRFRPRAAWPKWSVVRPPRRGTYRRRRGRLSSRRRGTSSSVWRSTSSCRCR